LKKRITLMLDDAVLTRLRKKQAHLIKTTHEGHSLSSVTNDVLKEAVI